MTIIETADGQVVLYDCHITDQNQAKVLGYLHRTLQGRHISAFANSHRDTDHMRGVQQIPRLVAPIDSVWDCGVTGSNPACYDYRAYMQLRRQVPCYQLTTGRDFSYGGTTFRVLGGKDSRIDDPNSQSLILKVEHGTWSVMLTGDSDVRAWRWITSQTCSGKLKSDLLVGGHHGSLSFFEDVGEDADELANYLPPPSPRRRPFARSGLLQATYSSSEPQNRGPQPRPLLASILDRPFEAYSLASLAQAPRVSPMYSGADWKTPSYARPRDVEFLAALASLYVAPKRKYFTRHIELIAPQAVVLSVGSNSYGHPDPKAIELYEQFTSDPPDATLPRVCRTDKHGTLTFQMTSGGWRLATGG